MKPLKTCVLVIKGVKIQSELESTGLKPPKTTEASLVNAARFGSQVEILAKNAD